jgi:WD40 repeat protein
MACSPARPGSSEFKLWNLADGQLVHDVFEEGHRSDADGVEPHAFVAFSPDGALIVYPGKDRTVVVWDIREKKPRLVEKLGLVPSAAAFSPDGRTLALGTNTGDSHGTVVTWAIGKDFPSRSGADHAIYSGVMTLAWSADGNDLFVGHRHRQMAVYELQFADSRRKTAPDRPLWNWKGALLVDALAFSGDGRLIALDNEGTAEIWNTATKEQVATLPEASGPLVLSHDGSLLAVSRRGALQIIGVK